VRLDLTKHNRNNKLAGAISLVGLEFYVRNPAGLGTRRIRLERLNLDGKTYRALDVEAIVRLERSVNLEELTIGLASRKPDEPVISETTKGGEDRSQAFHHSFQR
jgi:hypothetical protein